MGWLEGRTGKGPSRYFRRAPVHHICDCWLAPHSVLAQPCLSASLRIFLVRSGMEGEALLALHWFIQEII